MNKNVVIVEDEFFVANHLKKILEANGYTVLGIFHNGETLLEHLPFIQSAVFLLDIQLSTDISGIQVATELKKKNLPFVYITANALDSTFDSALTTSPAAYFSKPFKEIDVLAGVSIAFKQMKLKIEIDSGKEKYLVNPDEIVYIKSDGVYIDLFLVDGSSIVIRKPLRTIELELPSHFKRCHKSFIINCDKMTNIKSCFIYIDKLKIPFSKTYRHNFM
jgi:two-component system response regulator LytT